MSRLITSPENKRKYLSNVEQVIANWPFLAEGLVKLNELSTGCWRRITDAEWLAYIAKLVAQRDNFVCVITSKNDKPLTYAVGERQYDPVTNDASLFIYFLYSKNEIGSGLADILDEGERFCRANGISSITAQSVRTTGASIRWFEKLGFKRSALFFNKEV